MAEQDKVRRESAPEDDAVQPGFENKKEERKLARRPDYHGLYEVSEAQQGRARFTPLKVNNPGMVPGYGAFEEQYMIYMSPVQQAHLALGRTNDLLQAGAPRTPADIKPSVMRHFHKVDNVSPSTSEKIKANAANQWIEEQDELHANFDTFMQARESMTSAMSQFRSTQEILRRRSLQAKRAEDADEKEKIDAAAETLAKIVEVSAEALTYTSTLEGEFMDVEEEYTPTAEEEDGKVIQTAEVSRKGKTEHLKELAKKAGESIDLKTIFIWAMGDSKTYAELTAAIQLYDQQIAQTKSREDDWSIAAAWEKLDNVKLAIKGTKRSFAAKRGDARNAAQAFGQAMGDREKSIMVTMIAEAYQELDLFGTRATTEAATTWQKALPVYWWLNDETERYKVERENPYDSWVEDFQTVGGAVLDTSRSKQFLDQEQPKWHTAAQAWRDFLSDVMGKPFDPGEASVDSNTAS